MRAEGKVSGFRFQASTATEAGLLQAILRGVVIPGCAKHRTWNLEIPRGAIAPQRFDAEQSLGSFDRLSNQLQAWKPTTAYGTVYDVDCDREDADPIEAKLQPAVMGEM